MTLRPLSSAGRSCTRVAVLPPAAFAVHQLRYLLAYGPHASAELRETGHSYLHSVVPWLVLALGLAVGGFLHALGRALSGPPAATPSRSSAGARWAARLPASLVGLWLACAFALVAIFTAQELLEGLFATGHPGGLGGVFGDGGWWAVPVALVIGLLVAAIFRGAGRLIASVVARRTPPRAAPGPAIAVRRPLFAPALACAAPLVGGWSDRGPPR